MSRRVCAEPGCPILVAAGARDSRCDQHRKTRDKARGTKAERGYGPDHDKLRAQWAPLVATGNVKCSRCRHYIEPGAPWDLGHDDRDRSKYRGPEHRACNRATASRRISPGA